MKALYFLAFFLIFAFALFFSLLNLDPVQVYYYKGFSFEAPLALIMGVQLLLGVIMGLLVGFVSFLRLKTQVLSLQKKLRQMEGSSGV